MAWTLAEPNVTLPANTAVLINVQFRHPPLAGPSAETIRSLVENTGTVSVTTADESLITSVTPGLSEWEIQGTLTTDINSNELRNQLTASLGGQWNIFSAYINWIKVSSWEFPHPSTQTAVSLAAIAILGVMAFYILWRLKIL